MLGVFHRWISPCHSTLPRIMQDFEKLGAFYLGKLYDLEKGTARDELLLYDSKDLTTHAVCVGMTGSGKTGLCLALLEEAAIDGVPAIAIDPKGDLGNLLLTFPQLAPSDFRPWIDESAATRAGLAADQYAAQTAKQWRDGLASWGQQPDRIARFRDAVDVAIYTPGSNAGLPLTVLKSFAAPSPAVRADAEAMRERVSSAASGLLALLGIEADPVRSREHILVSTILDQTWRKGRSLDVAALIRTIQKPPFEKVGVFDLETFYPAKDRLGLSMQLNNLLASPSFAGWMEGEPLDVKRLLYTPAGKPRLSIVSIAHLSETERMFFVTILLSEVLAWVRGQPGTSSLRALLYMDEVFGYFPPTANPPSKKPMLTLLKQARAFGLGVVLATQNPVDLDYKGLSNTGTWFLGRLQTERDKARVLEGLEGASAQAGAAFEKQKMEAILARMGNRVFLMNNVHEDEPAVFQTRWVLSYLRGPLTRGQIQTLMQPRKRQGAEDALVPAAPAPAAPLAAADAAGATPALTLADLMLEPATPMPQAPQKAPEATEEDAPPRPGSERPFLPADVAQFFLPWRAGGSPGDGQLIYRPALLGRSRLHFVRATYDVDVWQPRILLRIVSDELPDPLWDTAELLDEDLPDLENEPATGSVFAAVPASLLRARSYSLFQKQFKDCLYRTQTITVYRCATLKQYSRPGETEGDFRVRLKQLAHERRDLDVEKLRRRYASKLATLKSRIRTAEEVVARERSQSHKASLESAVSFGSSLLGALMGRKLASGANVSRAATSMRSLGRAAQQRGDVARAQEKLDDLTEQLADLEKQFAREAGEIEAVYQTESLELEPLSVRPRKTDIAAEQIAVVWTPWRAGPGGELTALFDLKTTNRAVTA
jgi:hypothetical protein